MNVIKKAFGSHPKGTNGKDPKNRHGKVRRFKWWLRDRWRWFLALKWWQKALIILGPIVAILIIIPVATYIYYYQDIADRDRLMNHNNTGVVLLDQEGERFFSMGRAERRDVVPLDDISDHMKDALVASEDHNFYEHGGFSIWSTVRSIYLNLLARDATAYGGSTITQQLAKNTLLTDDRAFLRKYQELTVSMAIENRYSKDEILEMYLNSVHYGEGTFGIEQAADTYFGKHPRDLSLAESAMLVGVLPAPSAYSPISGDPELAKSRQAEVLTRMVRNDYITEQERTETLEVELAYQEPQQISNEAPHFTEMVLGELYEEYGEEQVMRSGYQVTTSLDLSLQREANRNVSSQRAYIEGMGGSNAGVIAIDPRNGEIRALVGSVDYANDEFGSVNMATTKRQPGSSFKPIYVAKALEDGVITPASIIRDEPIDINGYAPQNATRQFYGDVTVRDALARSLNIPAVKIMQQYGIDQSVEAAQTLGITALNNDADHGLSLAIGSSEAPLHQITNAYASFGNGGVQHEQTTIHSIRDKFDNEIYQNDDDGERVISDGAAYLISDILSDQQARSFMFGSQLDVDGRGVAVKTGTTDDNRDAWAVGYTPSIAMGVWVGNNDNATMLSGGADMAGPIWRQTMQYATQDGAEEFNRPSSVVERNVCYGSGGIAQQAGGNTYAEVFISTHVPNRSCNAVQSQPEEQRQPEPEPEPQEVDEPEEVEEPEPEPEPEPELPVDPPETPPDESGSGN